MFSAIVVLQIYSDVCVALFSELCNILDLNLDPGVSCMHIHMDDCAYYHNIQKLGDDYRYFLSSWTHWMSSVITLCKFSITDYVNVFCVVGSCLATKVL